MKKSRYTAEQIVFALRQAVHGMSVHSKGCQATTCWVNKTFVFVTPLDTLPLPPVRLHDDSQSAQRKTAILAPGPLSRQAQVVIQFHVQKDTTVAPAALRASIVFSASL